jgi:hypothetical protein
MLHFLANNVSYAPCRFTTTVSRGRALNNKFLVATGHSTDTDNPFFALSAGNFLEEEGGSPWFTYTKKTLYSLLTHPISMDPAVLQNVFMEQHGKVISLAVVPEG